NGAAGAVGHTRGARTPRRQHRGRETGEQCAAIDTHIAPSLVDADHHVARLDHGVGWLTGRELQLFDRFVGDGSGDRLAANIDLPVRGGRALLHLDDPAFESVASTDLHGTSPRGGGITPQAHWHWGRTIPAR